MYDGSEDSRGWKVFLYRVSWTKRPTLDPSVTKTEQFPLQDLYDASGFKEGRHSHAPLSLLHWVYGSLLQASLPREAHWQFWLTFLHSIKYTVIWLKQCSVFYIYSTSRSNRTVIGCSNSSTLFAVRWYQRSTMPFRNKPSSKKRMRVRCQVHWLCTVKEWTIYIRIRCIYK